MVNTISTNELQKAMVQIGHRITKRHPKMTPFIQTIKNNIHIIDLDKTAQKLDKALKFLTELAAKGGNVIFVGTKPAAKKIIKEYALANDIQYVDERWLGGTITNFPTISLLMKKLQKMTEEKTKDAWQKYTKKERLDLERELVHLEKMVGGIRSLNRLPDALYVVDIIEEATAVREAKRKKIPVVAIVDTNADPSMVTYPIPANDDASKSINFITKLVAEAIKEGREKTKAVVTDESKADKKSE